MSEFNPMVEQRPYFTCAFQHGLVMLVAERKPTTADGVPRCALCGRMMVYAGHAQIVIVQDVPLPIKAPLPQPMPATTLHRWIFHTLVGEIDGLTNHVHPEHGHCPNTFVCFCGFNRYDRSANSIHFRKGVAEGEN